MKMWIDRATGRLYVRDNAGVIIGGKGHQVFGGEVLTVDLDGKKAGSGIGASLDLSMVLEAIKANGKFVGEFAARKTEGGR